MYDEGRGLPQDFPRALSWYKKAARAGLVDAQYMVGRFYGRGRGVKQNPSAAFYWFNLAAAGGHPLAATLRDQHRHQISPAQRRRMEAEACILARERRTLPASSAASSQRCIYPMLDGPDPAGTSSTREDIRAALKALTKERWRTLGV